MPFGDLFKLPANVRPANAEIPGIDPRANLSGFQKMAYDLKYRPEAIQALGAGIASGDTAQGWLDHAKVSSGFRKDDMEMGMMAHDRDQLEQYLISQGMDPAQAKAAATNEKVLGHLFNLEEIKAREAAQAAQPANLYGTLQWGQDKDGKWHAYQLSDSGAPQEVFGADGVEMVPPGDIAYAKKLAQEQAEGTQAFDTGVNSIVGAVEAFDRLSADPKLDEYSGWRSTFSPGQFDTPEYKSWLSNFQQSTGQAFSAAFQTLKGGGPISEREGMAAQAAILAIEPGMDGAGIRKQLSIARAHILKGLASLENKTGNRRQVDPNILPPAELAQPAPAPAPGKSRYRVINP